MVLSRANSFCPVTGFTAFVSDNLHITFRPSCCCLQIASVSHTLGWHCARKHHLNLILVTEPLFPSASQLLKGITGLPWACSPLWVRWCFPLTMETWSVPRNGNIVKVAFQRENRSHGRWNVVPDLKAGAGPAQPDAIASFHGHWQCASPSRIAY